MVLLSDWRFHTYCKRLYTYYSWKLNVSPFRLANANFEHLALNICQCPECGLEYRILPHTHHHDPMEHHLKYSPQCLFVQCFYTNFKHSAPKVEEIIALWKCTNEVVRNFVDLKLYTPGEIDIGLQARLETDFKPFETIEEIVTFFQKQFVPKDIVKKIKGEYKCKMCIGINFATHIVIPCGHLCCSPCSTLFHQMHKCMNCRRDIVSLSKINF